MNKADHSTESDFTTPNHLKNAQPNAQQNGRPNFANKLGDIAVEDSMTVPVATVNERATATSAMITMKRLGLHCLPVIDDQRRLVGLLSDQDFYRSIHELHSTVEVCKIMNSNPQTISAEASVRDAAVKMIHDTISVLVVTRNENVIGIVTQQDLLKILVEELDWATALETERAPDPLERTEAFIYNSPLGAIVDTFSNAGI